MNSVTEKLEPSAMCMQAKHSCSKMMFHDPIYKSCTFLYCIYNTLVTTHLTHCSSMITERPMFSLNSALSAYLV